MEVIPPISVGNFQQLVELVVVSPKLAMRSEPWVACSIVSESSISAAGPDIVLSEDRAVVAPHPCEGWSSSLPNGAAKLAASAREGRGDFAVPWEIMAPGISTLDSVSSADMISDLASLLNVDTIISP